MSKKLGLSLDWQADHNDNTLTLADNEIHIWWLSLLSLSDEQMSLTHGLLNDRQKDKYKRRSTTQLQHAYLAGRYYLYKLLASYTDCQPHEIELNYNRLNKPSLKTSHSDDDHIEFNFTDTSVKNEIFGLFAFCRNKAVGVDLESLSRSGTNIAKIAKRRFTTQELDYVQDAQGNINKHKSLAIWTRKEAYGKAIGQGINFQMNERNLVGDQHCQYGFSDHQQQWQLYQIQPTENFIASVVHAGAQPLLIKAFNSSNHIP